MSHRAPVKKLNGTSFNFLLGALFLLRVDPRRSGVLRVKLERLSRGVNQTTIGVLTSIPQAVVSQIENGHLKPSPARLRRLSELYDVSPHDLLKDTSEPQR